jgi:hypothetical protein
METNAFVVANVTVIIVATAMFLHAVVVVVIVVVVVDDVVVVHVHVVAIVAPSYLQWVYTNRSLVIAVATA